MDKNVKKFNAFFTNKERSIILHSLTVYMEKLEFVIKNRRYYDVDIFTIDLLKSDYEDIIKLRDKFFSVYSIEELINIQEGY